MFRVRRSEFLNSGHYFIPAYSEFMPPPRMVERAYGTRDDRHFRRGEWPVTEYEEAFELRPGLESIGAQLVDALSRFGRGLRAQGIDGRKLEGNPCWPDDLRERGAPDNEKYVVMLPLALSRTQDDKGRVRWTLFGASEHGPGRAFRGFDATSIAREVYGPKAKFLFTFEPFATLPKRTRDAYLAGDLHIIPFPGSLLFFHSPSYHKLATQLPRAMQIPLLYSVDRNENPRGIRVPQSGWIRETEEVTKHGPIRQTTKRSHRWTRVHRYEDEIPELTLEQSVAQTLFSADPSEMRLYGKPMARNVQMWTAEYELLLDGPVATRKDIARAARDVDDGGVFGYRFFYPPMRVGSREVYWHRPVVHSLDGPHDAPLGYIECGDAELEPRLLDREIHRNLIALDPKSRTKARNVFDAGELAGPLEESFAQALAHAPFSGARVPSPAMTFEFTATRKFEDKYWKTIASLTKGNNADPPRALKKLGDTLLRYYERLNIEVEEDAFEWDTDFEYEWMAGWRDGSQRNIIAKIPGRDRTRAVIMADHYDTAYEEDVFKKTKNRRAAKGADDNHSATAALMLAAPIFKQLDLQTDIWLVHLTGEEFPADCLGARHLCQRIIEEKLTIDGVFVLDMVAHNNEKKRDVFQMCPGWGRESMLLARTAHEANVAWNASVDEWNTRQRRTRKGKRGKNALAKHLALRGEVRPSGDPSSTLYNTDGQIFSDCGIPVVLFMENYDINRHGYHDTKDTMANIDLDYGAALVSIAIESVARGAGRSDVIPSEARDPEVASRLGMTINAARS